MDRRPWRDPRRSSLLKVWFEPETARPGATVTLHVRLRNATPEPLRFDRARAGALDRLWTAGHDGWPRQFRLEGPTDPRPDRPVDGSVRLEPSEILACERTLRVERRADGPWLVDGPYGLPLKEGRNRIVYGFEGVAPGRGGAELAAWTGRLRREAVLAIEE